MKNIYIVKYRQPGQFFWRTLKNVRGDGLERDQFRWFITNDDEFYYVSLDAEVYFEGKRQEIINKQMNKETGQQVQTDFDN